MPASEQISIPRRFNGPLRSGNGGYCSGVVAGFVEGVAEVSLKAPVPLDTPLDVEREAAGSLRVLDGETPIAAAHSIADIEAEVPPAVSPREAGLATGRYRGSADGPFSRCFVCGRAREDGLGLFAGPVEGRRLVASPWTPPRWTADDAGHVRPEFVWAVLDCPTYFALYMERELPVSLLGRFAARLDGPVIAGEEHVVIAWPIEIEGRKHHAGSAVLTAGGETLAVARALLIAQRER